MSKLGNYITLWLIGGLCCFTGKTFAQNLWSSVTVNRSSVYVGQPVEVTIHAYTSTWFTAGIDPGNIRVEGAFTQYFRPVSNSVVVKGKTYAGVDLIYQVFPYKNTDILFPSLTLTVESPAEGDYKGKKHVMTTAEKRITVKPIPPDFTGNQWLVATNLSVSDRWNKNTNDVKVGDVLTRTITRTAYGTVPELIPPLEWDSVPGVRQYPSRSEVQKHETATSVYATRTETMHYLFMQEGEVSVPEVTLYWFQGRQEKLYKRTLAEKTFNILPNPDLGMIESIRDSLDALTKPEEQMAQSEESKFTLFGLTVPQLIFVAGVSAILLWLIVILAKKSIMKLKAQRKIYLASERYYFSKFRRALHHGDNKNITNAQYKWLDQLHLKEPNVTSLIEASGVDELQTDLENMENYAGGIKSKLNLESQHWKKAREEFLKRKKSMVNNEWINP